MKHFFYIHINKIKYCIYYKCVQIDKDLFNEAEEEVEEEVEPKEEVEAEVEG